jgi:hypothetical protein
MDEKKIEWIELKIKEVEARLNLLSNKVEQFNKRICHMHNRIGGERT